MTIPITAERATDIGRATPMKPTTIQRLRRSRPVGAKA